jgi:toxin ParE1/3/4
MSAYVLTARAAHDLLDIWEYIADESIDSADAVLTEIHDALDLLASAPGIGHRRRDVRDTRYRFWRVNRFIIAYFPETHRLQVVRIVGGHRDFRRLF